MKIFVVISVYLTSLSVFACLEGVSDYGFKCHEVNQNIIDEDRLLSSCNEDFNLASTGIFKKCLEENLANGERGLKVINECKSIDFRCSLIKKQDRPFSKYRCDKFIEMSQRGDLTQESVIGNCNMHSFGD